jgi:uncharacterized protein (TIRG00374 family)
MGEVLRVWLLDRNYGLSVGQAAGTVVVERFMDILLVLAQFGLAIMFVPVPDSVRHGAAAVLLGAVLLGVIMLGLAWRGPQAAEALLRRPNAVTRALAAFVRRLGEGMSALRQGSLLGLIFGMSLLIWSVELVDNWVVMRFYGLPATLAWSGVLIGVAAMSQMIPGGPGYLGSMQAVAKEVLGVFGVSPVLAVSVSLTLFVINSTLVVLFGGIAYFQEIRKPPYVSTSP